MLDYEIKIRTRAIEAITKLENELLIVDDTWYMNGAYAYINFQVGNDILGTDMRELEIDIEDVEYEKIKSQILEEKEKYIREAEEEIREELKEMEHQERIYWERQLRI